MSSVLNIQILFENQNVLVVNKPAGVSVHGDGKSDQYTIADWVLENYPDISGVGEDALYNAIVVKRPGIVHRLDKDTTGCLVIAKNTESYTSLKKQFQNHRIVKTYHAVVYGSIKSETFIVNESIGRSTSDVRKWATGKNARGVLREARTKFSVLARYGVEEQKGSTEVGTYSYLECIPETGRTHQLRVHLRSVGHAIVSDSLYAPHREKAFSFERQALHAVSISFSDTSFQTIQIDAPFPDDFKNARLAFGL